MADTKNFRSEYGFNSGTAEVINSSGKVVAAAVSTLDTDDLSGFIPFEDVTKAQAVTWVEAWHNKYEDWNIAIIKARLDRKIAEKITPVIEKH